MPPLQEVGADQQHEELDGQRRGAHRRARQSQTRCLQRRRRAQRRRPGDGRGPHGDEVAVQRDKPCVAQPAGPEKRSLAPASQEPLEQFEER